MSSGYDYREHRVVEFDRLEDLQAVLDRHAEEGWRLRQTILSDGHTVALNCCAMTCV